MAFSLSMTEDPTEMFVKRIDEDAFDRLVLAAVSVVLAASFRGTKVGPVRRPVAGAGESFGVDECLGQDRLMGIKTHPVRTEPTQALPQQMGCQVRDPDPWQNEKTRVVEHLEEIGFAGARIPADESIPAVHLPGSRPPQEACNRPVLGEDKILDMLAHGPTIAKVVVVIDQAIEKALVRAGSSYLIRLDRSQVLEGTVDEGCINRSRSNPGSSDIVWRPLSDRRQGDRSLPVETDEQGPANTVSQKSVGLSPVPLDADLFRKSTSAPLQIRVDEILNEPDFLGADRAAPEGDLCVHEPGHNTDVTGTPEGERKKERFFTERCKRVPFYFKALNGYEKRTE